MSVFRCHYCDFTDPDSEVTFHHLFTHSGVSKRRPDGSSPASLLAVGTGEKAGVVIPVAPVDPRVGGQQPVAG